MVVVDEIVIVSPAEMPVEGGVHINRGFLLVF